MKVILSDLSADAEAFAGYDTCFFCLGVSSVGMAEAEYRRITYDLTLSVAKTLVANCVDPTMSYVSGAGTDATEHGRVRWARIKGATENALRALPMRSYLFRPGYIQPVGGVTSKTRLYAVIYRVVAPLYPLLRRLMPRAVTTTEAIGRAMIAVAEQRGPTRVLDSADINDAAR